MLFRGAYLPHHPMYQKEQDFFESMAIYKQILIFNISCLQKHPHVEVFASYFVSSAPYPCIRSRQNTIFLEKQVKKLEFGNNIISPN